MAVSPPDVQHAIATSSSPAAQSHELSSAQQCRTFFGLPESLQLSVAKDMRLDDLRQFVSRLDPDEATDVLGLTDERTRQEILQRLAENRRAKIEFLLEFSPESAVGMMHLDYITVEADSSFEALAVRVRRYEERTGRFPTVFVLEGDELLGELPGYTLALTDRTQPTSLTTFTRFRPFSTTGRTRTFSAFSSFSDSRRSSSEPLSLSLSLSLSY
jgi:magnesium transporter